MEQAAETLLLMKGITKRFPGVLALNRVDLELRRGEILGLIGENGAGKSTLMRILGGIYRPDSGEILIDGETARIDDVQHALSCGISVIHQELNLAPNLDAASNIFLGREPRVSPLKVVRRRELYSRAAAVAGRVGLTIDVRTLVDDLSLGTQQLVEIAKALSASARILVLDEPTSSLSRGEAETLFRVMGELRSQGVSMIYITHRLHEVREVCDRVIVLRDGERVGELAKEEITRDNMVRLMVGRDISRFFPEAGDRAASEPALVLRGFRCPSCKGVFDLEANRGEILGIAGLVGAGRTELVRSIFGVEPASVGDVLVDGQAVRIRSVRDAVRAGIGLVPEDRKQLGLILEMAVRENVSLPGLNTYHSWKLDRRREDQVASEQCRALAVKSTGLEQEVGLLSGGNQQKIALAKWLALRPKVLILDEPTRGIDVGSKSEIYKLIRGLADAGVAVIMVSSEMEEIIGLSDRVLVMHEGMPMGILSRSEMDEESIMQLATGGKR